MKTYKPKNYCSYSFTDLFRESNTNPINLKDLTQKEINIIVIELCDKIGWYYEEKISNEIVFVAFSPEKY